MTGNARATRSPLLERTHSARLLPPGPGNAGKQPPRVLRDGLSERKSDGVLRLKR